MGIAELLKLEKKDRQAYEESLKKHRDLKNAMDTRYNQGVHAGIELGIEKGKKETIAETVIGMFKAGIELNTICQITGLNIKEVNQILEGVGLV